MADHDEIVRLYGPWQDRSPQDAAELLATYSGSWWVAGGWAIEAFTHVPRPHADLDIGIPRVDVGSFIAHVGAELDVWAAAGSLTPILTGQAGGLAEHCQNLWLRPSGAEPWEYDVLLEHADSTTWTYKRDPRIIRPLAEVLWTREGITFLRPEVQLLLKAKHRRAKDDLDFNQCLQTMDQPSRTWLAASLHLAHPGHPWLDRLA